MQFTLGFDPAHDLKHAQERVQADDLGKWDEIVPRSDLAMQSGWLVLPETYLSDWPHTLLPTPWATSQLCQRLGIPAAYFRKCPPALQDAQVNHWLPQPLDLTKEPEAWLLRGKHYKVRGILSQRYAKMDNALLLDALAPVLDEQFQVAGFSLTEDSLHLRVVSPHHARDIRPNDRLLVGLHLANSEVGARAVTLDALVFRLVCANGLVRLVKGKSLLYRRHIGLSDPAAFRQQLGQAISRALISGVGFLDQLSWTANTYLPRMVETIAALGEQWNLSQTMQERITANLLAEPERDQELLWSLINAITLAAQSLPPDDRYDLEAKAALLAEEGFLKIGSAKSLSNARHRMPQIGAPEPMPGFPNGSLPTDYDDRRSEVTEEGPAELLLAQALIETRERTETMAFATHLTLATGHNLTRHNLLLGEGDEMQRVSVSITYELERGDLDVPLLATAKASEVAEAHRAAAQVLRAHAFCPHSPTPPPSLTSDGSAQPGPENDGQEGAGAEDVEAEAGGLQASHLEDAPFRAEEPEEELTGERTDDEAPPDDEEGDVPSSVPTYRQWIAGAGMCRHDQSPSPDQAPSPGQEAPPSQTAGATIIPGPPPNGSPSNGSYANGSLPSGTSPAGGETPTGPLLTPPKRLAIQSLAAKIGLTPPEFSSLLRQRFGVWSLHLLTKEQGEALHRALQDRLKEKQLEQQQTEEQQAPEPAQSQKAAPSRSASPYRSASRYGDGTAAHTGK